MFWVLKKGWFVTKREKQRGERKREEKNRGGKRWITAWIDECV